MLIGPLLSVGQDTNTLFSLTATSSFALALGVAPSPRVPSTALLTSFSLNNRPLIVSAPHRFYFIHAHHITFERRNACL